MLIVLGFLFRKKFSFKYKLEAAFSLVLVATIGSLYYSEIRGFTPCVLCWYQRIFMYPLVILLGIAVWKKDYGVKKYALPLAGIGSFFAIMHYIQQKTAVTVLEFCSLEGGASCGVPFVFRFGYITIPFMALTAFIGVILLLWNLKEDVSSKRK
ncbi:MAG: disulfide oxidoreductase [Candidatus Woesearchaeota archaeon]